MSNQEENLGQAMGIMGNQKDAGNPSTTPISLDPINTADGKIVARDALVAKTE